MKNQILGIVAMGVLGSCNSEQKNEVGRYVPLSSKSDGAIVDTKTGIIYEYRYEYDNSGYYLKDSLGKEIYYKHPSRVHIEQVNPAKKESISFYIDVKAER
jgi:hypothetical protein